MNEARIQTLLKQGEGRQVEFKTCRDALNRDIYETVCAFLNRSGGDLLLGVTDNGQVTGVNPAAVEQLKKDFVSALNSPQKINPPFYLNVEDIAFEGKTVLHVYVPESSQVHRCNGRIFDRNEDGDFNITDNTHQVSALYQRKQTSYSENRVFPYVKLSDLRSDLIVRARKLAVIQRPGHPWQEMDDMEMLKSAQLYLRDFQTDKDGFTLAAVLLLGKDDVILSVLPHHRTDAILRRENLDRYDDRDDIRTNLLESYDRLMAFVAKHLPDNFYLEGDQRISIRDHIFREVAANMLIHREFLNAFPAKLVIENSRVMAENSNRPHGHGLINPDNFSPFPKNPVIARFFKEIGRADELGSGVRKLFKYCRAYGGYNPELLEADIFRFVLHLADSVQIEKPSVQIEKPSVQIEKPSVQIEKPSVQIEKPSVQIEKPSVKTSQKIMLLMQQDKKINAVQIAEKLELSPRAVEMQIANLKKAGCLKRVGPDKGGHWEVLS